MSVKAYINREGERIGIGIERGRERERAWKSYRAYVIIYVGC